MKKAQRFTDFSREGIAGLIESKDSKNTQLVTKTALNTFRAFCGEKHPDKTQDFAKISKEELNELLVDFHPNARKKTPEVTTRSQLFQVFGLAYNDETLTSFPTHFLNSQIKSLKLSWLNVNDRVSPKLNIMNQY